MTEVGRLAFRVEGDNWNCYWCPNQTDMNDAMFLASIRMPLVAPPKLARKNEFIALMRGCFDDICKDQFGSKPEWGKPRAAPDTERSGEA